MALSTFLTYRVGSTGTMISSFHWASTNPHLSHQATISSQEYQQRSTRHCSTNIKTIWRTWDFWSTNTRSSPRPMTLHWRWWDRIFSIPLTTMYAYLYVVRAAQHQSHDLDMVSSWLSNQSVSLSSLEYSFHSSPSISMGLNIYVTRFLCQKHKAFP